MLLWQVVHSFICNEYSTIVGLVVATINLRRRQMNRMSLYSYQINYLYQFREHVRIHIIDSGVIVLLLDEYVDATSYKIIFNNT